MDFGVSVRFLVVSEEDDGLDWGEVMLWGVAEPAGFGEADEKGSQPIGQFISGGISATCCISIIHGDLEDFGGLSG